MKHLITSAFLLSAFFFTGCMQKAYHQQDNSVDFSRISTYAWAEGDNDKNYDTRRPNQNSLRDTKIMQTVDRYLQGHGWSQNKTNPDVYLVFDVVVDQSQQQVNTPVYSQPVTRFYYNPAARRWVPIYYPSTFMGYNTATQQVKEGTLTLTMMNPGSDKVIWQGWTTSQIYGRKMSDEKIERDVQAIITELKKY
ncbi:MAG: DUF4136 domain-containing protein [Bacteroidetes bacterium]|nr:DUF4136 domain-containing protein [Bacteroidota bacterium]